MEDAKTFLFYLFGLASLIMVSILFTGRIEPLEPEPVSAPVTSRISTVRTMATLPEADQRRCLSNHQKIRLREIPDVTSLEGAHFGERSDWHVTSWK